MRHELTAEIAKKAPKHWGYIDDTLSFIVGTRHSAQSFCADLDGAIAPLKWEHSISSDSQHFLDIQVTAYTSVDRIVCFGTSMYRKPRSVPHDLASLSDHPCAHKSGIFKCESYRAMLLSGTEGAYINAIVDLFGCLEDAGYPARCFS